MLIILIFCKEEKGSVAVSTLTDDNAADGKIGSSILLNIVVLIHQEQYHNLKDLALSVSIEASELVEIFQWKNPEDINDEDRENIKFELADVLIYIFFMCDKLGIEPYEIIREKMEINKGRVFKF